MNLHKFHWKPIWSGNWGLVNCFDWGKHYTSTLKVWNKVFLSKVVFIYKDGKSTAWVSEDDLHKFSTYLAKSVGNDISKIKILSANLKKETDRVLTFIKKEPRITAIVYKQYLSKVRKYYIAHVAVKYIVDALSPPQLKQLLSILEEARTYAEPVFDATIKFDQRLAESISGEIRIKQELVLAASPQEILNFFNKNKFPNENILMARHQHSALVFNKKAHLAVGEKAKLIEQALIPKQNLHGTCAYPGKVRGTARIVLNHDDSFEKCEILVTGMTRPDFLPLMGKAAAIITDSGGLLCHAAITARELRIPCVIGTKFATKIIKNGDQIEVDAQAGIIKILNRK